MILTSVGEIGVHAAERDYVLRPSLYAMSLLGDPRQIVGVFATVMASPGSDVSQRLQMQDCLATIFACANDDVSPVFGHWGPEGHVAGTAPIEHIIHIARCLLRHGVVGALEELPRRADEEPEYVQEFDARAHVAVAMAHLGLSEKDAWQLTMTSLVGALRAKFPRPDRESPGSRAPTKDQHEATMAWFERIEAAREKKQGSH